MCGWWVGVGEWVIVNIALHLYLLPIAYMHAFCYDQIDFRPL